MKIYFEKYIQNIQSLKEKPVFHFLYYNIKFVNINMTLKLLYFV